MREIRVFILVLALALTFVPVSGAAAPEADKLLIVASLFPQYDFARQIAGDRATVKLLLPPGAESHTFDPRPSDIRTLNRADLFVYTGEIMEPWAKRILDSLDNKRLQAVDASLGAELEHEHAEHGHSEEYDPHIWLDPTLALKMIDTLTDALCRTDPAGATQYRANAAEYRAEIEQLDRAFARLLEKARERGDDTLIFGGPFAYLYFLKHYGLNYVTAWDTCSAQGEPGIRRIVAVIRAVQERDIGFIFYDPLEDAKVARSIAEETGAELLPFNTMHNVTQSVFESGVTYRDLLTANMKNVGKALNIPESEMEFLNF